jgi:hypothetical protein
VTFHQGASSSLNTICSRGHHCHYDRLIMQCTGRQIIAAKSGGHCESPARAMPPACSETVSGLDHNQQLGSTSILSKPVHRRRNQANDPVA